MTIEAVVVADTVVMAIQEEAVVVTTTIAAVAGTLTIKGTAVDTFAVLGAAPVVAAQEEEVITRSSAWNWKRAV
jgi:hypothetical protein